MNKIHLTRGIRIGLHGITRAGLPPHHHHYQHYQQQLYIGRYRAFTPFSFSSWMTRFKGSGEKEKEKTEEASAAEAVKGEGGGRGKEEEAKGEPVAEVEAVPVAKVEEKLAPAKASAEEKPAPAPTSTSEIIEGIYGEKKQQRKLTNQQKNEEQRKRAEEIKLRNKQKNEEDQKRAAARKEARAEAKAKARAKAEEGSEARAEARSEARAIAKAEAQAVAEARAEKRAEATKKEQEEEAKTRAEAAERARKRAEVATKAKAEAEAKAQMIAKVQAEMPPMTTGNVHDAASFASHMNLLRLDRRDDAADEMSTTPVFTGDVMKSAAHTSRHGEDVFTQFGLLAGLTSDQDSAADAATTLAAAAVACQQREKRELEKQEEQQEEEQQQQQQQQQQSPDPRLFYNVSAPSSVFICGSQGSGKSHTLSCLLENCLVHSAANVLPRPLTGIVFHYDTFNSDTSGTPCEAAYLASHKDVEVRVLCAPTNRVKMKQIYSCLPNVVVEDFRIHESQLNTKRMLDLMAMGSVKGDAWPLYMHTVTRILRQMRIEQQKFGETGFDYGDFKGRLANEGLIGTQMGPLQQRLDALESFMVQHEATMTKLFSNDRRRLRMNKFKKGRVTLDDTWTPKAGRLTIVDLSCPCVTDATACALFNICLSLFLEQESNVGRVIALDEAHKYMGESTESMALTASLLSTIRLQRHLAARIFISTQEPTVSPKLLDLCSMTVVHRFTSPEWLETLQVHLAGASRLSGERFEVGEPRSEEGSLERIFSKIVTLRTGEALLFSPAAAIGVRRSAGGRKDDGDGWELIKLSNGVLKVRVRSRVTYDGGKSILAE